MTAIFNPMAFPKADVSVLAPKLQAFATTLQGLMVEHDLSLAPRERPYALVQDLVPSMSSRAFGNFWVPFRVGCNFFGGSLETRMNALSSTARTYTQTADALFEVESSPPVSNPKAHRRAAQLHRLAAKANALSLACYLRLPEFDATGEVVRASLHELLHNVSFLADLPRLATVYGMLADLQPDSSREAHQYHRNAAQWYAVQLNADAQSFRFDHFRQWIFDATHSGDPSNIAFELRQAAIGFERFAEGFRPDDGILFYEGDGQDVAMAANASFLAGISWLRSMWYDLPYVDEPPKAPAIRHLASLFSRASTYFGLSVVSGQHEHASDRRVARAIEYDVRALR
ncbi:MAG: hypothetical protein HY540_02075 [Deltaproteobacteria bacterium]|nr:hypothetical protein [Deltaproteobacteria bacterium]